MSRHFIQGYQHGCDLCFCHNIVSVSPAVIVYLTILRLAFMVWTSYANCTITHTVEMFQTHWVDTWLVQTSMDGECVYMNILHHLENHWNYELNCIIRYFSTKQNMCTFCAYLWQRRDGFVCVCAVWFFLDLERDKTWIIETCETGKKKKCSFLERLHLIIVLCKFKINSLSAWEIQLFYLLILVCCIYPVQ